MWGGLLCNLGNTGYEKAMENKEMTNRKSQIVLPVNATTLFTSVVGAVIIGFLGYITTKTFEWSDAAKGIAGINDAIEQQVMLDKEQNKKIFDFGQRIQRIEETRFRSEDAKELKDAIVSELTKEIKISVQPVAESARRNERDIQELEKDLDRIKHPD